MNKWLLRLLVALMTFILSLFLTGVLRFFFGGNLLFGGGPRTVTLTLPPRPFSDFSADQAQIADIYSQYGAAQTSRDRAFFERVEAENFRLFTDDKSITREQDLDWMERQQVPGTYEVRVRRIRVFGTSAVAHGRIAVTYETGETNEWSFIDVWVKRNGAWRIQSTTSTE